MATLRFRSEGNALKRRKALNRKHDFLSRQHKSDLADSQKKALYSLKLAAAPKSDEESRAIATVGAHSKTAFSSFAASDLKKRVVKESLKRQRGAKPAGAEAIARAFQQITAQSVIEKRWTLFGHTL